MMPSWTPFFLLALFVLSSQLVQAQDGSRIGLVIGAPSSVLGTSPTVGIIWNFADRLALRPDFSFAHSNSGNASSTSFNLDVSTLFYLKTRGEVRLYLAPSVGYSRYTTTWQTNDTPSPFGTPSPSGFGPDPGMQQGSGQLPNVSVSRTSVYAAAVSFGGQYRFGQRFGLFGEAGAAYQRNPNVAFVGAGGTTITHSWTTRTRVGLLLYF